jgi:hypothetical protein
MVSRVLNLENLSIFCFMNPLKIYQQLISRAQEESRDYTSNTSYERHHIIPKCMGGKGKNTQWRTHPNIVVLTPREHYLAHVLLCEIYPEVSRLKFALWAMSNQLGENRKYKISSRQYERVRESYLKLVKGVAKTKEHKEKISKANKGKKREKFTESHRANISKSIRGLRKTEKHKENLSKSKNIPVFQYDLNGVFLKQWDSSKVAGNTLNIDPGDISSCRRGEKKSAGGFIWEDRKRVVKPYMHSNSSNIIQYNLDGEFIQEFKSISEASKILKLNPSGISNCANGRSKHSGGFIWKHKK